MDVSKFPRWKVYVYLIMTRPRRKRISSLVSQFLMWTIVLSLVFFVFSTDEILFKHYRWVFDTAEDAAALIFTVEYLMRLVSLRVTERWRVNWAELKWATSFEGVIDVLSIGPWWIEKLLKKDMPTTTPLRFFRCLRVLNHETSVGAVKTLARVIYFNKEVLGVACVIGVILLMW